MLVSRGFRGLLSIIHSSTIDDVMFRLSLRELLSFVALVALGITSLRYASDAWLALVAGVTMIALFVALIVAVVDRGPRQAFAIGFALTAIAYGAVLMTGQTTRGNSGNVTSINVEFNTWEGRLPTTRLLRYVHTAVEHGGYYDFKTGVEVPDYDPAKDPRPRMGGGGFGGAGGFSTISYREVPPSGVFMPIGHCWWVLLLAYAGGLLARYVYWRRVREQKPLAAESP